MWAQFWGSIRMSGNSSISKTKTAWHWTARMHSPALWPSLSCPLLLPQPLFHDETWIVRVAPGVAASIPTGRAPSGLFPQWCATRCPDSQCASLHIPAVTTSWAVLVTNPWSFLAEHVKTPASSGKVSAMTRVQISSGGENRAPHQSEIPKPPWRSQTPLLSKTGNRGNDYHRIILQSIHSRVSLQWSYQFNLAARAFRSDPFVVILDKVSLGHQGLLYIKRG